MPLLALLAGLLNVLAGDPGDPIDTLFAPYRGPCPGASVAVIRNGEIELERSYGMANLEQHERTSSRTNYRLASVTKQFTAMGISILAQRGALSLDDRATRFLPELAPIAPDLTIRQLLTHVSGLPDYERLIPDDDHHQYVDSEILALMAKQRPVQPPGTTYHYCNTNYALLALVIERASRMSYPEFLRRNIFGPLGMRDSAAYPRGSNIPHRAYGYSGVADEFYELADQNRVTTVLGDGGVYSSIRDLARWIGALETNRLLDGKRLAEATSPLVQAEAPSISYGFGWRIADFYGQKLVFHTGATSGFKNALLWLPARKLAVIVLTNRRQGSPLELAKQVLERYASR